MLEMLKQLCNDLEELENRSWVRSNKKRELGNITEAYKQEGKFIAYRTARERLEEVIAKLESEELEEEDEWAEYDEPHYPFDEVGYDPYTGGFDPDL